MLGGRGAMEREADRDGKEEVDGVEGKFQRKTDHL